MNFTNWLYEELNKRGWSQSELARRGKIAQSTISSILTGRSNPGPKACIAIAKAFNMPAELVMRKANLAVAPKATPRKEQLKRYIERLTEKDVEALIHIIKKMTFNNPDNNT